MSQKEIKESVLLLDEEGNLANPGYGKRNYFIYNRDKINVSKWRIKEWNYYQVSNGRFMVVLNYFDISVAAGVTAEICDLKTGKTYTDSAIELITANRNNMDGSADQPYYFEYKYQNRHLIMDVRRDGHHLYFKGKASGKNFEIQLFAQKGIDHESLTMATPFDEPGQFFLSQKLNCMPTSGFVKIGKEKIQLNSSNTYTVLDWARGVWPYSNFWYWANGSTRMDGKLFGFELTWGFGDETYATETALFYDGKCHKIGKVHLLEDPEIKGYMQPWHFKDEEGRLNLIMNPFYDHESGLIFANSVGMKSHQVHGLWNGYVVLDDGTKLNIKNMYAFCEKVYNKW